MDIRRPLTNLDIQMLDWFAPRQKPIHILLTKSDKLSKDKSLRALSDVKKIVQTKWADSFHTKCTVQLFSSLKKQGIEEADEIIQSWLALNKNHIPNLVS
jgi:GTP-binding protein